MELCKIVGKYCASVAFGVALILSPACGDIVDGSYNGAGINSCIYYAENEDPFTFE